MSLSREEAILYLNQVLFRRRDILCRTLEVNRNSLASEKIPDDEDSFESLQADIISQLVEAENRELARIDHALERVEEGLYGTCEDCGKGIPLTRLYAMLCATRCINCQRKNECEDLVSPSEVEYSD
jgi:DnaK suppressor protein